MRSLNDCGIPVVAPEALCDRLTAEGVTGVRGFSPSAGAEDRVRLVLDPAPGTDATSRTLRRFALRHDLPCFTSQRAGELAVAAVTDGAGSDDFRPNLQALYT